MGMNFNRKMPEPAEIKKLYPLSEKIKEIKAARDKEIAQVFTGESDKFLLIRTSLLWTMFTDLLTFSKRLRIRF